MGYTRIKDTTADKRKMLQTRIDNFATFQWRGENSWDSTDAAKYGYGMFIIAEKKGDLKIYNRPGFSNEYSKSQYQQNGNNLVGVTINTQSISFKVGVYWFSMDDWRKILAWLDPYEIDYLGFSFETHYNYLVKLSKIDETVPRYIVGYEGGEPRYYSEMTLTWEVQGPNCVRAIDRYTFSSTLNTNVFTTKPTTSTAINNCYTDIETPLVYYYHMPLIFSSTTNADSVTLNLKAKRLKDSNTTTYDLFNIELINLSSFISGASTTDAIFNLDLTYDSEAGLLFYKFGDNSRKLLNLLATSTTGENIVNSISTNQFYFPASLRNSDITKASELYNWSFELTITTNLSYSTSGSYPIEADIVCYGRTNVI